MGRVSNESDWAPVPRSLTIDSSKTEQYYGVLVRGTTAGGLLRGFCAATLDRPSRRMDSDFLRDVVVKATEVLQVLATGEKQHSRGAGHP